MCDLLRRWTESLALLKAQVGAAPPITVESTRGRLRKLYEDAQLIGVLLPKPSFQDSAFEGMDFSRDVAKEALQFATEEARREKACERWRRYNSRRQEMIRQALGPRRQYKAHIGPNECGCGCGGKVAANRRFCVGHAARWRGWMMRIERGEMPRECLPPALQNSLRWTKCMHCGGWIPTTDALGRPIIKRVGYDCARRARFLERRGAASSFLPAPMSRGG
jgi:hypothetical protein